MVMPSRVEPSGKPVVGTGMAPEMFTLIPGSCEYVTLGSKRDIEGGIKLRTLR